MLVERYDDYLNRIDYQYYYQPLEYYFPWENGETPWCKHYDHVGETPCGWRDPSGIILVNGIYCFPLSEEEDTHYPQTIGPMCPPHQGPQCPWTIHGLNRPLPS